MLNIDYRNYQLLFCDFKVFVLEALNNLVINILAILFPHEVEYGSPILQCKVIYNRTAVSVMVCFGLIPRTAMVFWGFVPSMVTLIC